MGIGTGGVTRTIAVATSRGQGTRRSLSPAEMVEETAEVSEHVGEGALEDELLVRSRGIDDRSVVRIEGRVGRTDIIIKKRTCLDVVRERESNRGVL